MRKLAVAALAVLAFACTSRAQTTYDSVPAGFVNVNVGNPGFATFYFGHPVNGQPGTSVLVIQCGLFNRAEFFTNYDTPEVMQSEFFAVTCDSTPTFENGFKVLTTTLNSIPLNESLVMQGHDADGNPITQNLNLTINSASWVVKNPGRYQKTSGSAEVGY